MQKEIQDIATRVKALEPEARRQFFESVCAENQGLADAIQDYLQNTDDHTVTETINENLRTHSHFASQLQGKMIGPYQIDKPLGEGGMGYVFLGHQEEPIRRKVAVKIIKPGMDSQLILNRFSAERQALALMNHRHIAKIFDAGVTAEGLPYFVMEYIPGRHITSYCDDHQLSIAQRIELFLQVCDAIQHANQNGILHRDLKPSNILVTESGGAPEVKIIDFGIAKAVATSLTEESFHTELGIVVGTLEYMSPEQLSDGPRDIDTRSDVYTLGVLLQELLSGVRPFNRREFKDKDFFSVQNHVLFSDPVKPSQRLKSQPEDTIAKIAAARALNSHEFKKRLQGDLDWIILKAQARVRDQRYISPRELKVDLQRYLQRKPVFAGPPTLWYRFKKFTSRHRLIVAFSGVLLAALVAAFFSISYALIKARHANEKSESTLALMEKLLVSVDPAQKGPDLKVVTLLESFQSRLEEISDRDVKFRLSGTMAATYTNIGQKEQAIQIYQSMLDQLDEDLVQDRIWLAKMRNAQLGIQIEITPSEALTEQARAFHAQCLDWFGTEAPQTLLAEWNVGQLLLSTGQNEKALALARPLLQKKLKTFGKYDPRTLSTMSLIGAALSLQEKAQEALLIHQDVHAVSKVVFGGDSPHVLSSKVNLSNAFEDLGQLSKALRLRQEAYAEAAKAFGEGHPKTCWIRESLAISNASLGYYAKAIELLELNLLKATQELGEDHIEVAYSELSLARTLIRTKNFQAAQDHGRRALNIFEKVAGPDHPQTLDSQEILALAHFGLGDLQKALDIQAQAVHARQSKYGDSETKTIHALAIQAVLKAQNEPFQAMQRFNGHYEKMQGTFSKLGLLGDLFNMLQHMEMEQLFGKYYPDYFELLENTMGLDSPIAQDFLKSYQNYSLNQGQSLQAKKLNALLIH